MRQLCLRTLVRVVLLFMLIGYVVSLTLLIVRRFLLHVFDMTRLELHILFSYIGCGVGFCSGDFRRDGCASTLEFVATADYMYTVVCCCFACYVWSGIGTGCSLVACGSRTCAVAVASVADDYYDCCIDSYSGFSAC